MEKLLAQIAELGESLGESKLELRENGISTEGLNALADGWGEGW